MALVVGKRAVYALAKDSAELSLSKVGEVPSPGSIIGAARGPKDVLYYVAEDAPLVLMRWDVSSGESSEFVKLPVAVKKAVFYRNKIYCIPVDGTRFVCVDPLNLSVEQLDTHHTIVDMEPADHGFVVEDPEGSLFGYHFNYGSCKVMGVSAAQLCGRYKRCSVAVLAGQSDPIGTNERGEVVKPPAIPGLIAGDFVSVGDEVFVFKKSSQSVETLDGKMSCTLPSDLASDGIVGFASVPEEENEEMCTLCFCEFDGDGDGITLDCGHRFHKDCVMQWVGRWDEFKAKGNHIAFTNAVCPGGCKHLVRHPLLGSLSEAILSVFQNVARQSSRILQDMPATKLDEDLLFYVCGKCGNPFYGGENVCFRSQGGEPRKDPADLICESCASDYFCPAHGRDFVVYKCFYCCNPATERSFGNRYICERCSARWTTTTEPDPLPCPGPGQCPLGGNDHADNAYAIGCLACLPAAALDYDKITPAPAREDAPPAPEVA